MHLSDDELQNSDRPPTIAGLAEKSALDAPACSRRCGAVFCSTESQDAEKLVKSKSGTLAPALIKVIRAAVKAGVKPNAVARRHSGVSPAAVRLALAEGKS